MAAKRLTGAGGFYFSRTGLNDPYGPRGDIRPRARHSQAGVSQLSNGTAPVLGGIRSHRQGGGGTEGTQGHPRAHLRHASREEGWSPGSRGLVLCKCHTNCTNRDTNRHTNCCEIHTNHTNRRIRAKVSLFNRIPLSLTVCMVCMYFTTVCMPVCIPVCTGLYGMYLQKTKPRLLNTYGFKFRTAPKIVKMRKFRHCRPSDLNSWKQAPGLTPGLKSRRVARTIVCDFSIGGGRS